MFNQIQYKKLQVYRALFEKQNNRPCIVRILEHNEFGCSVHLAGESLKVAHCFEYATFIVFEKDKLNQISPRFCNLDATPSLIHYVEWTFHTYEICVEKSDTMDFSSLFLFFFFGLIDMICPITCLIRIHKKINYQQKVQKNNKVLIKFINTYKK